MRKKLKLTRRMALGFLGAVALPAAGKAQATPPPTMGALTPAQMREDLIFLRTQWAPLDQSFSAEQRTAFDQVMDSAIAAVDTRSMPDFVLDIMQAVAIPHNGHSMPRGVARMLGPLPFRAWWFSDGLHIVSVRSGFEELLGARIEKLGILTPEEVFLRAAPYVSGTEQFRKGFGIDYLTTTGVLHRIGATADTGRISLALRSRDGTSRTVQLGGVQAAGPPGSHARYALIPDDAGTPDRLSHVLDGVVERPLTYAREVDMSRSWIGPQGHVLYIRSNILQNLSREPTEALEQKALFGVIQNTVVPKRPRFIVFDLRLNSGGNFFNLALFAEALPKLIPEDGRMFVLVGRTTFSAAIVTAAMLRNHGGKKVTLVGETMGDNPKFWAEPGRKILPNSKIPVDYATQFEDWAAGCDDIGTCYWPLFALGMKGVSLAPDVSVAPTFAEYASGRDPVLDAALSMAMP